ncbi:MAG: C10 family peptidase, partial [Candidatus Cloacimonetes bacterium]|nr:C10 family peptidase [Candidatus Cloacimonadota bacterium]
MKKSRTILLILAIIVIIPSMVYSAAVTQTTAEQVAMNLYFERNDKAPDYFEIVESFIETENADNIYYIFNFDKTGFVIVAADDIAVPILGYVFKHNYTLENHPPQFDAMLASFREQILYARNNDLSPPQKTVDKWNRLKVTTDIFVPENVRAVGPLLSTTWNQGQFYNESCPADAGSIPSDPNTPGNGYVWAGCTATATAQVMKYHAHPATGEGTHSYTHATYGPQSANYGATTYNWATMPNNVTAVTPSVHTLLYHVGVGAEMNYGLYGSGAWIGGAVPASALSALQNHFKYDPNSYYDQRNNYSATPSVWHAMLKTELDNNRPLVYEGYNSGYSDGHAFVIDGYQGVANDNYHVNFGWSGSYDGYYTLDAIAPVLPTHDYRFYQGALFGVEPRKWRPLPDVSIDVSLLPYTGVDLDHYYEGPVALLSYSVVTDLSLEEFTLTINTNNELVFTANPVVTSDVNINITIRATYTGGFADDTFNFIITGASSGSTIKWEQLPDLSPFGMDVTASNNPMFGPPVVLADDFLCTTTGLITDIHVWGSWYQDILPEDMGSVIFHLSIHEDIPAGVLADWSMPGDVLWMRDFMFGEYDSELYNEGPEGWFDPHEQIYIPIGDSLCWLYNFYIDAAEAFMQEGTPENPIIYWLEVQAEFMDPLAMFGWKTSETHWNDDAVWVQDVAPFVGLWNELRYPPGHEYYPDSIDLAFQITTEEEEEELDFGDAPDPTYPTLLANDGARHIIDSLIYMGFSIDAEIDGQPDAAATGDDNDGNDDEDGVIFVNPLYIGQSVNVDVTVSVDGFINAWIDFDIDGGWGEVNDQIFTDVSVAAGTNTLSFTVPASATLGTTFARFRFNMQGGLTFTGLADDGEVEDYRVTIEEEVTYEYDFGDAPEGASAIAYPSSGVTGSFPTCITVGPVGSYIQHGFGENWSWFGPMVDIETDGNAGACPGCFPAYDLDECFQDGDAGLITPDSYTIDATGAVIPCPGATGSSLGIVCQTANWGVDIDIDVTNTMPVDGYVNVLFDWNHDGQWQNDATTQCAGVMTPEHVLVDFVVPLGYSGPLSGILPPPLSFQIGPNDGYVWVRFSITEAPVGNDWDGSGVFEDGETEDCLLHVEEEVEELDFGDAPDDTTGTLYPTLAINDGARHILDGVTYLGVSIDSELDGQPDATATGDDLANLDDEDGVIFKQIMTGSPAQVIVTTSAPGYLQGWMDFNADGDWTDPNEHIFTDVYIHFASTVCLNYYVPVTATTGNTFARFRFSTVSGLGITGQAPDGEVEDYGVEIIEDPDVKWSQLPCEELPGLHCHDYTDPYNVITIADDWLCNGGLVRDIHWWGNYEAVNSGIDHFHLSIHANDPANCLPLDPEIWGVDVLLSQVNETATGMFNSSGDMIYSYEYILSAPFEQIDSTYYWLDISAFSNDPTNYAIWRWQESSRSTAPILCTAAEKTLFMSWLSIVWNTPSPTRYSDMAFEITSFVPDLEYGDAPDPSYPTLLANDGARHI